VFSIFPDLENMGLDTLIRQIGQVLTEILRILVWGLLISIKINFMKIAQTCQGDTLANLDQEGPNVKKQQKYVMQTQLHGTTFRRLDYRALASS